MKKTLFIAAILIISGCTSIGSPKYGCKGLPAGSKCIGTSDLYESTNGGEIDIKQTPANANNNERDRKTTSSSPVKVKEASTVDLVIETFVTPVLPDKPVPIRTPAQIMRIWVASWEDIESGALISPGFIYTEIEPRRWVIGKTESASSSQARLFKPLD